VSLTTGRGPLGPNPAGRFSTPLPTGVVYVEPFPRRVRGVVDGRCVVDSERALLVHRPGRPPTYAFPVADVRQTACTAEPEPEAPSHVSVPWDAVEQWYEEEERVFGHPRNPYHRVDCVRTTRRLRVEVGIVTLVDTRDTIGVYETSSAPKLYVRPEAVRMDLLVRSTTTTYCAYKGTASYWSAVVDDARVDDVAWSYDDPIAECAAIRGLLSFDSARSTVVDDLPTPLTF
jgi:uncharacterized protein (DUF427 family)